MAEQNAGPAQPMRPDWLRHEIRNPLNVLVGSLRLIEMGGVTPAQQKQIDACRAAVDRITGILDSLGGDGTPAFVERAAAELRALGGVTFLGKPFERSDLLRTVQMVARTHRNIRLLAADDVPEIGWLLESLLASSGCTLEMVRDGAAAVDRARTDGFSAIILDLEMPVMNGVDAARAIREQERKDGREPVPIVIASGHDLGANERVLDMPDEDPDVVTPDPEIAPLVPEFLANRRADVARIQGFIDSGSWEELRMLGHRLKGTGRGYGFARITEIGKALEQAGSTEDAGAARSAASKLDAYLDRVRVNPPAPPGAGDQG